jgi:hypothetical protein
VEYNVMAVVSAPIWGVVVTACGLVARVLSRRASDATARAWTVGAVVLAGLGVVAVLFSLVWGREWWTYTVPEPAGVLVMGILPLMATGYAVWRRPDAAAWRILVISLGTVAVAALLFFGVGFISGAGAG